MLFWRTQESSLREFLTFEYVALSLCSLFVFICHICYMNQLPIQRLQFGRSPFHMTSEVNPHSQALASHVVVGTVHIIESVWEKTIYSTYISRLATKFCSFFTDYTGMQKGQYKLNIPAPFTSCFLLFWNDSCLTVKGKSRDHLHDLSSVAQELQPQNTTDWRGAEEAQKKGLKVSRQDQYHWMHSRSFISPRTSIKKFDMSTVYTAFLSK